MKKKMMNMKNQMPKRRSPRNNQMTNMQKKSTKKRENCTMEKDVGCLT